MPHTFISYVREDRRIAEYIVSILTANGVSTWIDAEKIGVGAHWKDELRKAIESGDRFLCLFSPTRAGRDRSEAHSELKIAIDELARRPRDRAWFLPISIDGAVIPADPIGGGETLQDLHYIDVAQLGWPAAMRQLLAAHGVDEPVFAIGDPLAPGFGDVADIVGGQFSVRNFTPKGLMDAHEGVIFHITGGTCERYPDGQIQMAFSTSGPSEAIQAMNTRLGLADVQATSSDATISTDPHKPTLFTSKRRHVFRVGEYLELPASPPVRLEEDMPMNASFEATGYLRGNVFVGLFTADWKFAFSGMPLFVNAEGEFQVEVVSTTRPPST